MATLNELRDTLKSLQNYETEKREIWIQSGDSTSGDAYNAWSNIRNKIDRLQNLILVEESIKSSSKKEMDTNSTNKSDIIIPNNISDNNIPVKEANQTIDKVFENLKNKIQYYDTSPKDILEYLSHRDKMLKSLVGDYDKLLDNSKVLKNIVPGTLFYKILDSETLSESVKLDINKIRENKDSFDYWYRALTVSALTISIIKFNQFDYKKADYLIDFLSDREDNVWERALVGLYISLMYRDTEN